MNRLWLLPLLLVLVTPAFGADVGIFGAGIVNVRDYGADATGASDASAAIQAAVNALSTGGTLFVPAGTYLVGRPIALKSHARYSGVGGFSGSVLTTGAGTHSIFTWATGEILQFVEIDHLTFAGAGSAIRSGAAFDYLANAHIHHNHFAASLAEGLYANLILSVIEYNTFGKFGTPGKSSRHIYSVGDPAGNASNANRIARNLFYQATALEAIRFESGYQVDFLENDFELNQTSSGRVVAINGMYSVQFRGNWFENNAGAAQIYLNQNGSGTIGNYVAAIEGNWFQLNGAGNQSIVSLGHASDHVTFVNNAGTSMEGGKAFVVYGGVQETGIATFYGNSFVGYAGPLGNVPYHAGNFTASSGTWTVQVSDQVTLRWSIRDNIMAVRLFLDHTSVSATPVSLFMTIPAGRIAAETVAVPIRTVDNGIAGVGVAGVTIGATRIQFNKDVASSAWSASPSNTGVTGEISFLVR